MADEPSKLTVRCPDCGSDLVIDAATGTVLSHRKAKQPLAGGKDFDSLLKGLDDDKNRSIWIRGPAPKIVLPALYGRIRPRPVGSSSRRCARASTPVRCRSKRLNAYLFGS